MPDILLIPTSFERRLIEPSLRRRLAARRPAVNQFEMDGYTLETCGFGLIAAGIGAANAIARHRPQRVLLMGIAGSLNDSAQVGSAYRFNHVTCHGIGVGSSLADCHRSACQMGWAQCEANERHSAIGDTIRIDSGGWPARSQDGHLLSVTTASANEAEAAQRRVHFPQALAEDMEGFAVAMACHLANVPLQIVRGLSNRAGDRNRANWRIESALNAAAELACDQWAMDP